MDFAGRCDNSRSVDEAWIHCTQNAARVSAT
jgi:hypothetical protein